MRIENIHTPHPNTRDRFLHAIATYPSTTITGIKCVDGKRFSGTRIEWSTKNSPLTHHTVVFIEEKGSYTVFLASDGTKERFENGSKRLLEEIEITLKATPNY